MIRKSFAWVTCLVLLVGVTAVAYDRNDFLFLDEIEIGMMGVGRTIVAADAITEFAVEILGVIDQPGDLSDFIVVRVSGEPIGRSGGIAQGMSGSPIYVDGKMIGALSRAAVWSKDFTPIGLVTPIEPMLAVLEATNVARTPTEPNPLAILTDVRLVEAASIPSAEAIAAAPDAIFAYPVSTPILAQGLSGRSLEILMSGFSMGETTFHLIGDLLSPVVEPQARGLATLDLALLPISGAGPAGTIDPASLEPGSSIGVGLATGDISIGALGTLTYREGDTLIGFGHRFIYNGPSQFPMTTVSIIDTMKAYDASYKLGALGSTIGTVLEDRIAAIGGQIGVPFDGIDLSIATTDLDSERERTFYVELVDEPRLMPELLLSTGFEAIDSTLDRVGQGTVVVTYEIDGAAMPMSLVRRDTFFSAVDIAVYPPLQLAGIVGALQYNEFQDPEIEQIAVTMEFTEEIKGIYVSDFVIDRLVYTPGDTIRFRLYLQTYQGEALTREGELVIPQGLIAEYLLVRAYGGPRYIESGETPDVFEGLGDLIKAIEGIPNYEMLTVELFAVDPFAARSDALFGVTDVTFEFPEYVVYGEREENAI
ncbi:SpoIVB peptidase S55 domain-containing protein, partial [Candidatus Bipolaricaulota bacterium]